MAPLLGSVGLQEHLDWVQIRIECHLPKYWKKTVALLRALGRRVQQILSTTPSVSLCICTVFLP